jgi:putative inorganic carbon (hco3(-)) transporter
VHTEPRPVERLGRYASITLCAGLFILPLFSINGRLITLAVSDLVLPIVLFSAGLTLLIQESLYRALAAVPWRQLFPFAAWLGWITVSAAFGVQFRISEVDPYILKKLIGFVVLAAYALSGYVIGRKLGYDDVVRVLVIASAIGTAIGVVRLFLLPFDIGYASLPYGYRLLGMTHNPNLFGLQQAAVFAMAIDWLRRDSTKTGWNDRPSRREWLIAVVLAGLWLSGSRTALFALVPVLLGSLALRCLPLVSLARYMVLSAFVAAVAFGVFSGYRAIIESSVGSIPLILSFLRTTSNVGLLIATEPQGVDHRSYIHQRAFELFSQHPWFGVGLGQFYLDFQSTGDPQAGEIHSSYLWILTELGVFGFLLAAWCAAGIAMRALRLSYGKLLMSPISLLIFYAVAAFGADVIFQRPLYFFAGVLAAVASAKKLRAL